MPDAVYSLVDPWTRKPIPREVRNQFSEEISPTGGQYARPPFQGHLAFGMDPARLAGIIKAADNGSTQEWMILAEEIEELFPHYGSVLGKRRRQVAQLPITVNDANSSRAAKKHGDLVRDWLKTDVLQRATFDALDALAKGYSVHEIVWDQRPGATVPARLLYRPQRFFEVSWQDGNTVWLRSENGFEDLVQHKFLLHRHPSKSGNIVRGGLTRLVAFLWMFASYTAKDWAQFVQTYGLPMRVGRYGPEASDSDKRVLWRAVASIAGDVAAIIPKSMELEFVKGAENNAGSELYLKRADWLNREVSKLVLGGTAGTEAIAGGHSVGKEHRDVEEDVERFDAGLLSATVTRCLVAPMVAFTFGPQDEYPTVTIGRPDTVPLKEVVDAVGKLGGMGLKVKASQILERLQLEEPGEGDATVGGVPASITERVQVPARVQPGDVELPNDTNAPKGLMSSLLALHAEADPEIVDALSQRLAVEAAGALHGLTDQVRHVFETATSLHDMTHRLHALHLHPQAFAEAMARGMALAQLVGQASLLDEMRAQHVVRMSALTARERDALAPEDFAVPELRELPIRDADHVKLAWDMVDRQHGLSDAQRAEARRRILAKAHELGLDTSGWAK